MFYFKRNKELHGIVVCHVDDFLHAGDAGFDSTVMHNLKSLFLAGRHEETEFSYVGFKVDQDSSCIAINQNEYVQLATKYCFATFTNLTKIRPTNT